MIEWENINGTMHGNVNEVWIYLVWKEQGIEQYYADVFDPIMYNWFDWDIPFETQADAKQWCEMHHATGAGDD